MTVGISILVVLIDFETEISALVIYTVENICTSVSDKHELKKKTLQFCIYYPKLEYNIRGN